MTSSIRKMAVAFLLVAIATTITTTHRVAATAAEEQAMSFSTFDGIDHGKALVDWLRSTEGGFFHPDLEIRRIGEGGNYYGMFTTAEIPEDDILLQIPRGMLVTPIETFDVGDRVTLFQDDETYMATVSEVYDDGTYQLVHEDGDRSDDATEEDFDIVSSMCKTTQRLVQELKLGNASHLSAYVNYLNSQPIGQLPSAWSEPGKNLFYEIVSGFFVPNIGSGYQPQQHQLLPPFDPFYHIKDYREDCNSRDGTSGENAYMLLLQRGWDDLMIPVFDMMSHGNGRWLNTKIPGSVHDPETPVTVQARRKIQKGEEIYTTYNHCEDCEFRRLWYGTPELLRDYGFVEQYPQRWVFDEQDVIFDIDYQDEDPQKTLHLQYVEGHVLKDEEDISFFAEQLQRLRNLGDTMFLHRNTNVPELEWDVLVRFREAYVTALDLLLKQATGNDASSCQGGGDGGSSSSSCPIHKSSRYETLIQSPDYEEYWQDYRPQTCDDYGNFHVAFWENTEVIKSPYQLITFLENKLSFPKTDTCFMLEQTWQICTSYRPQYHEMAVHYPARFLDSVKRVIFVGGGDSMLLHDVLKYDELEMVIGLEIDQEVTRGSFKHFGTSPHFDNEKVHWWFGDAAKSMLMLPKEYFGTFDLVLVDLSETVAAFSVTKELNIMQALSMLVKPDGILVKNEYEYFPKQRKIFRDSLHIHYYHTPVVCSQSLILGSNGLDFMRGKFKTHPSVKNIYKLLDEPDIHYLVARDYQKNTTNPEAYCTNEKKELVYQEQSPGILMIVEAEKAAADKIQTSKSLQTIVENALQQKSIGFKVISTVTSEPNIPPVTVTILREGYIVARAFPEYSYCGFDVHLWSDFGKHDDTRQALIAAVGSQITTSSSYRIVAGGMFGVSTWKEDEENRGPKLPLCSETQPEAQSSISADTARKLSEEEISRNKLIAMEETIEFVQSGNNTGFLAAVICGKKTKADDDSSCPMVDVVKKLKGISDVMVVHSCDNLVSNMEYVQNAISQMLACEKSTWNLFNSTVSEKQQKIRVMFIDESADRPFLSGIQAMLKGPHSKNTFLETSLNIVASSPKGETWRKIFVDTFRKKVFPQEPSFTADIYFNRSATDSSSFFVSVASTGDDGLFLKRVVEYADRMEQKTGLIAEIDNVRGGDFVYQDPFEPDQVFTFDDFDHTSQREQWTTQKPLALQVVFQVVKAANKKQDISATFLKTALETTLSTVVKHDKNDVWMEKFADVGDGAVVVAVWPRGNVVILWDGRDHVDLNLLIYKEDFKFIRDFEKTFLKEVPGMERALRDTQPRGVNRVVNFEKDLSKGFTPAWLL
jgi:spermidine synthase